MFQAVPDDPLDRALRLVDTIRSSDRPLVDWQSELAELPHLVDELQSFTAVADRGRAELHFVVGWFAWWSYVLSQRADQSSFSLAVQHLSAYFRSGGDWRTLPPLLLRELVELEEAEARTELDAARAGSCSPDEIWRIARRWQAITDATDGRAATKNSRRYWWSVALLHWYDLVAASPDVDTPDVPVDVLDRVISTAEQALEPSSVFDSHQADMLVHAANARIRRYERTPSRQPPRDRDRDRDAAVAHLRSVLRLAAAPAAHRVHASRSAARLLAASDDPEDREQAGKLFEYAVTTLPLVAPRNLRSSEREDRLGDFAGLAREAAAFRLRTPGGPDAADPLQLLELGRGVVLGEALGMRTELRLLSRSAPAAAREFVRLRDLLDSTSPPPGDRDTDHAAEQVRRRGWAADLDTLVERIRNLDGFASFGRVPALPQLLEETSAGPIVVLTSSGPDTDALIVTTTGVDVVTLHDVDEQTVRSQAVRFHAAVQSLPRAGFTERSTLTEQMADILCWLWTTVVEPVVHRLGLPAGNDSPTRVWWVPCGPFSLLPVHAAGQPATSDGPESGLLDRAVSSYTPTIQALRHARRGDPGRPDPAGGRRGQSLVVAVHQSPGHAPLPHVRREADRLAGSLPDVVLLTDAQPNVRTRQRTPTVAQVLDALPDAAIAHFACHAWNDPLVPSNSSLVLADGTNGRLSAETIARSTSTHAELAYLSACSTVVAYNESLYDEALHLASAFQRAGFPRVIGTLWDINDETAAEVARLFYGDVTSHTGLYTDDAQPHPERAAVSLHEAIRATRAKYPGLARIWAPFIHVGA